MKSVKPLLLAFLFLAGSVSLAVAQDTAEPAEPVDFELETLEGGTLALTELRGQWVVLNYWATWCAPCRKEIPDLSQLHARADHISVVGLAYEETEPEAFIEFLAEFDPSYPNLLVNVFDPPQPFGAPRALPTTIVLDPKGVPVKTFVGPVTGVQIEEFVAEAGG
ncbi:MAG: TlpA disulfide reductase family protein [Pseudomonadota bacterium]